MTKSFNSFLKIIACLALFLSVYPFIKLKCALLYQNNLRIILDTALSVAVGFSGAFAEFILDKLFQKKAIYRTICVFLCIIPIAVAVICSKAYYGIINIPDIIFSSVLYISCFVSGIICFPKEYGKILGNVFIAFCICSYTVSVLALALLKGNSNQLDFIIILTLIFVFYSIINNQSNIDFLMERRRYDKKSLPKKIRFFNLSLLFVFYLLIFVLMFFRKFILKAILFVKNIVFFIIKCVCDLYEWIISHLSKGDSVLTETADEVIGEYSNSSGILSTIIEMILVIGFIALLVYIFIRQKDSIVSSVKRAFFDIIRFFEDLFSPKRKALPSDDGYYTDTEEYIEPGFSFDKDNRIRKKQKNLRKDYKRYKNMKNSDEKFKFGYSLAVKLINEKYVDIFPCDTPLEITEKTKDYDIDGLSDITDTYNLLKYQMSGYSGDFSELNTLLKKLYD